MALTEWLTVFEDAALRESTDGYRVEEWGILGSTIHRTHYQDLIAEQ